MSKWSLSKKIADTSTLWKAERGWRSAKLVPRQPSWGCRVTRRERKGFLSFFYVWNEINSSTIIKSLETTSIVEHNVFRAGKCLYGETWLYLSSHLRLGYVCLVHNIQDISSPSMYTLHTSDAIPILPMSLILHWWLFVSYDYLASKHVQFSKNPSSELRKFYGKS